MAGSLFFCVMPLSIVSINANGLRDANKRSGFLQWLRSFPTLPDIVCIQECHVLSLEECQTWFSSSGFLCAVSSGSSHSCGCIILFVILVPCVTRGMMMMGVSYNVSSLFPTKFSVLFVFMRLTGTLNVIAFLMT